MMNVVNSGSRYQIYGESVRTYKNLPVASYEVACSPMSGFFLNSRHDLVVNEEKIYGDHERRVEKVMRSFAAANRNFGIILSGQKGIGKSLFARVLASKAIEKQLPVIMVNTYYPGIADFLGSIEQEVVVIFDEFDKTFGGVDGNDPQEELLSLFDGLDNGKKLFVVTCNNANKLNSYLLNRPGRFHYHFTINNPSDEEVSQYMHDKLDEQYWSVIDSVVSFARTVNITYDYLRAIAFEINQGYSLEEALSDLNISRTTDVHFDFEIKMNDGSVYTAFHSNIDFCKKNSDWVRAWGNGGSLCLSYLPSDIEFKDGKMRLDKDKVKLELDEDDFHGITKEDFEKLNATLKVKSVTLTKCNFSDGNKYILV